MTTANSRNIQCVGGAVPDSNKTLTSQTKACQPSAQSYSSQPPPLPRSIHRNYMPKEHPTSLGSNKLPNRAAIGINSEIEEQTPSSTSNLNNQQRNIAEEKLQASAAKISPPVQINEVTSSDDETTPPPLPQRPPGGHGAINKRRTLCRELADLQNNASSMTPGKNYYEIITHYLYLLGFLEMLEYLFLHIIPNLQELVAMHPGKPL